MRVRTADAWWLVQQLCRKGDIDDAWAAVAIQHGLFAEADAVDLEWWQCVAVLDVLADCPDGLAGLRGRLERDLGGSAGAAS